MFPGQFGDGSVVGLEQEVEEGEWQAKTIYDGFVVGDQSCLGGGWM